jgi:c-di-GMP-binding flagellar brake protein YcgR
MSSDRANDAAQLRKHPRLEAVFPLAYSIEGDAAVNHGRSRDIGGGGISFDSSEPIAPNAEVTIWFELRPGLKISVSGRIVSTSVDRAANTHRHRFMFTKISENVRDSILTYIFESWRHSLLNQV